MNTALNAPTFVIFGLGSLAALFTSKWFVVQLLHWPSIAVYRIAAFLPLLMGLVLIGLFPALQMRGYNVDFPVLMGAAFGIGFSLDNARPRSLLANPRCHFSFPLLLGVDRCILAMVAGGS